MGKIEDMKTLRSKMHGRFSATREVAETVPTESEELGDLAEGPSELRDQQPAFPRAKVNIHGAAISVLPEELTPQEKLDLERGLAAKAAKKRSAKPERGGGRTACMSVMLYPDEYEGFEEDALKAGLTLSSWGRAVLKGEIGR